MYFNISSSLNKKKEHLWLHSYVFISIQHVTPMYCVFQLSINAFDYNCHVDLIKLLKQEGELYSLRKARQRMSELFPLTEGWCIYDIVLDDSTSK